MTDVIRKTLASRGHLVIHSFNKFFPGWQRDTYFLRASFVDLLQRVLGLVATRPLQKDHDVAINPFARIDALNFIFPGTGWWLERGLFKTCWWGRRGRMRCILPRFFAICIAIWSGRGRSSAAPLFGLRFFPLSIISKDSLSATNALQILV
jgi:hypothetical protein